MITQDSDAGVDSDTSLITSSFFHHVQDTAQRLLNLPYEEPYDQHEIKRNAIRDLRKHGADTELFIDSINEGRYQTAAEYYVFTMNMLNVRFIVSNALTRRR